LHFLFYQVREFSYLSSSILESQTVFLTDLLRLVSSGGDTFAIAKIDVRNEQDEFTDVSEREFNCKESEFTR
jgi:hypothetical protein